MYMAVDGVYSYANLFADESNLMRRVEVEKDCKIVEDDLNTIFFRGCII